MTTPAPSPTHLERIGARRWQSPEGEERWYLNNLPELLGWKIRRYGTGKISSALYRGAKISNGRATAAMTTLGLAKLWFADGQWHSRGLTPEQHAEAVSAAVAAMGTDAA